MPCISDRRGTGTPRNTLLSVLDRVVFAAGGCVLWTGKATTKGYGQVGWHGRVVSVHRLMYEQFVGPVPEGFTLDHACRNHLCCNPAHLEPVTNHENILRGLVPSANRQVCKNGIHDITTFGSIYVDSEGVDRCRECRRESKCAHARRRKLIAA